MISRKYMLTGLVLVGIVAFNTQAGFWSRFSGIKNSVAGCCSNVMDGYRKVAKRVCDATPLRKWLGRHLLPVAGMFVVSSLPTVPLAVVALAWRLLGGSVNLVPLAKWMSFLFASGALSGAVIGKDCEFFLKRYCGIRFRGASYRESSLPMVLLGVVALAWRLAGGSVSLVSLAKWMIFAKWMPFLFASGALSGAAIGQGCEFFLKRYCGIRLRGGSWGDLSVKSSVCDDNNESSQAQITDEADNNNA